MLDFIGARFPSACELQPLHAHKLFGAGWSLPGSSISQGATCKQAPFPRAGMPATRTGIPDGFKSQDNFKPMIISQPREPTRPELQPSS